MVDDRKSFTHNDSENSGAAPKSSPFPFSRMTNFSCTKKLILLQEKVENIKAMSHDLILLALSRIIVSV